MLLLPAAKFALALNSGWPCCKREKDAIFIACRNLHLFAFVSHKAMIGMHLMTRGATHSLRNGKALLHVRLVLCVSCVDSYQ